MSSKQLGLSMIELLITIIALGIIIGTIVPLVQLVRLNTLNQAAGTATVLAGKKLSTNLDYAYSIGFANFTADLCTTYPTTNICNDSFLPGFISKVNVTSGCNNMLPASNCKTITVLVSNPGIFNNITLVNLSSVLTNSTY